MTQTCKHENILADCRLCQLEEERDHALAGKEHFKAKAEAAEARVRELAEQLEEERYRLQRLTTNPRFLGVRNPLGL